MKIVQVQGFGGVDQLQVLELPDCKPDKGEIAVNIKACGVNYSDILQREGLYLGGPKPPYFSGIEAAGIVQKNLSGNPNFAEGTPVIVIKSSGLQSNHTVVKPEHCIPLPQGISLEEGAAFAIQYLIAYHAITTIARAARSETILIHSAGGGVGTAAVQIAKLLGLKIIATTSCTEKRERILQLGANIVTDYKSFVNTCRKTRVDIVLDTVGGKIFQRSFSLLSESGRVVIVGISSKNPPIIDTTKLLFQSKTVSGLHLNALLSCRDAVQSSLTTIMKWILEKKLHIQIGHTLPLEKVQEAHKIISNRQNYGKILLIP